MTWTLFVPGEPKTTQTGSIVRTPDGRAFPRRRHTEWAASVKFFAHQERPALRFEGPVRVEAVFFRRRPASAPKRLAYPVTAPDADNCWKGLGEILEGLVYETDAQIAELVLRKRFADPAFGPGVRITVEALG